MSTLTHERTDLFIGGVATVERPGTHPDHLPSHRGTVRRRPDWHLDRRRPCDRRGPACPADSTLGRLDWSATRPVDAGAGRRAGPPEATTRPDWSAMRTACRSAS